MSSYIKEYKNPNTNKIQKCWCIDDYYGQHRYGYFFRKDGKDADWEDFHLLQQNENNFDIFDEYEIDFKLNQV